MSNAGKIDILAKRSRIKNYQIVMKYLSLIYKFTKRIFFILPETPATAQIEVTNRCNFSCPMCQRFALGVPLGDMNFEEYVKIIDHLADVKDIVLTSWGEPFMHPKIFEMIAYAKDKGHSVYLTSNGSLLNADLRKKLLSSGLDAITFSIDEVKTDDDTLGHEIKNQLGNICALLDERKNSEHKLQVFFQSTLHKNREEKLFEVINFAARHGADRVRISRLDVRFNENLKRPSLKEEKEFLKKIIKISNEQRIAVEFLPYLLFSGLAGKIYYRLHPLLHCLGKYCLRLFDYVYINQKAEVTPCCALPLLSMGNLFEDNLENIWKSQKFIDFRKQQKIICGKCDVLSPRPYNFE